MIEIKWPKQVIKNNDLINKPILYVTVTTPKDQSMLHRDLAILGYIPVFIKNIDDSELWRFNHPNGEKI